MLTILVISLQTQAIILMPIKIQIIMCDYVNPILLRPVHGIVLAINSVLLKMEQFMSWLQSDRDAVSFFLLVAEYL